LSATLGNPTRARAPGRAPPRRVEAPLRQQALASSSLASACSSRPRDLRSSSSRLAGSKASRVSQASSALPQAYASRSRPACRPRVGCRPSRRRGRPSSKDSSTASGSGLDELAAPLSACLASASGDPGGVPAVQRKSLASSSASRGPRSRHAARRSAARATVESLWTSSSCSRRTQAVNVLPLATPSRRRAGLVHLPDAPLPPASKSCPWHVLEQESRLVAVGAGTARTTRHCLAAAEPCPSTRRSPFCGPRRASRRAGSRPARAQPRARPGSAAWTGPALEGFEGQHRPAGTKGHPSGDPRPDRVEDGRSRHAPPFATTRRRALLPGACGPGCPAPCSNASAARACWPLLARGETRPAT
jgi:hypothetical protein